MAAVAALCSCSNNEVMEAPESLQTPVTFGTYVGNSVNGRAAVIDNDGLQTGTNTDRENVAKDFGVFGYYTSTSFWQTTDRPNFMYNEQVTYNASNWEYAPLKYWPNNTDDKVSFFAYAPYSSGSDNNISMAPVNTMTEPKISFTVNNTVQSQTDLLYAEQSAASGNTFDLEKQNTTAKVSFNFKHALARIGFTVRAITDETAASGTNVLDSKTKIYVKKVVLLKGTDLTGDYDGSTNDASTQVFYTGGTLNLKNTTKDVALWENPTGTQMLSIAATTSDAGDFVSAESATVTVATTGATENTNGFVLNNTNSATVNPLNNTSSYMMIIPQNLSSDSENLRVYVEYDVVTKGDWGNNSDNDVIIKNKVTAQGLKINFESGKAYTINLQLGMTSVKVNANVTDWSDPAAESSTNNPANS